MIEAALEFRAGSQACIANSIFQLPKDLRPTRILMEEGHAASVKAQFETLKTSMDTGTSALLQAPSGTFDISAAKRGRVEVRCFFDVGPEVITAFLTRMAASLPVFAFACAPSEREQRNLVRTQLGDNAIETWVGRDTNHYVPGLYWLTLLSADLASRHSVSIPALSRLARNYTEPVRGQHLFQFYDAPDAWGKSTAVTEAISGMSGLFHIDAARSDLQQAESFLQLQTFARKWP